MIRNVISGILVNVSLVDRLGRTLELFWHEGRHIVEAVDLMEYRIQVQNRTGSRIEVLTAVDGMNTLKKEIADLYRNRGMVISPFNLYDVTGWRIDDTQTRPIVFTVVDAETVAKQVTGSSLNLGVIAVAVYREYKVQPMNNLRGAQAKGIDLGLESFSMRGPGVGSGMGDRVIRDEVGSTYFERATTDPADVIQIYAMPTWWMKKEGLLGSDRRNNRPEGFPGSSTGYGNINKI